MQRYKDKISVYQAVLLALTIILSPSVRFTPRFAALKSESAGWLSAIVPFLIMLAFSFIMFSLINKYKDASFPEIMNDICGAVAGKALLVLYIIWLSLLTALYTRYYDERLLSTIMPNVRNLLFVVIMLVSVAILLRKSFVAIARMNEVLFPAMFIIFTLCFIFSLFIIDAKNLIPVSYLDIIPVAKSGLGITGLWCYFPLVFFFSDIIDNKQEVKKYNFKALVFIAIATTLFLIMCIGVRSPLLVEDMSIPFFTVVRQIDLFNTIERIESVTVSMWIFSDFVLISVFIALTMDMLKSLFALKQTKSFIIMYCILLFFITKILASSIFELENLSSKIYIYLNIVFIVVIPTLIFVIGKIRKKV